MENIFSSFTTLFDRKETTEITPLAKEVLENSFDEKGEFSEKKFFESLMNRHVYLVSGAKGTGKTLLASIIAYILHEDYDVVLANYTLNKKLIPNFEPLTKASQLKTRNALIILDEAYILVSSRTAMSKKNLLINNLLARSRKFNQKYIIITQIIKAVDKQLRRIANGVFIPRIDKWVEVNGERIPAELHVYFFESIEMLEFLSDWMEFIITIEDEYLQLYDTSEDIYEFEFDISDDKTKKVKSAGGGESGRTRKTRRRKKRT